MRQTRLFWIVALLALCLGAHAQNISPYWSLTGNSNASTSSKLGTTNNINLRLYTNNLERMRILSANGYVGIGTTAPTERLHVNGPAGANALRVQVNSNTKLLVASNGGAAIGANVAPPANGLYVSGNVGIGTAVPAAKLHVAGNGIFNGNVGIGTTTSVLGYKVNIEGGGVKILRAWDYGEEENYGLYAEGHTGIYATGFMGIIASGMTGVTGHGHRGVEGNGSYAGVEGYSEEGNGVYGISDSNTAGRFESISGIGLSASTFSGPYAGAFYGKVYLSSGYTTSDKNLKQNIQKFDGGMGIINKLKPRQYEFKTDEKYNLLRLPKGNHYGLLAQDVEEVLPNLVSTADHHISKVQRQERFKEKMPSSKIVQSDKSEIMSIKALNYIELIPIMIKGMQELSSKDSDIDALKEQIAQQQQQITELRKMVMELKSGGTGSTTLISGYLEQNTPNPVSGSTLIRYTIPNGAGTAKLNLTNAKGQLVKSITLNKGAGQVQLSASMLAAGTYSYTLILDGQQVDTKRLIIAK